MPTERSRHIINEMVELSSNVIKLCQTNRLPVSVVDQVTRSVTSIGANFSEAQEASSKKDFMNKIYIAKKEAAETKYWLKVISRLTGNSNDLGALLEQTQQLSMMLQKIINTSRKNHR